MTATLKTSPELEAVTTRLIRWGCWSKTDAFGVGLPPHSWEGRCHERGGATPDLSPRPLPHYPEEEQTEAFVVRMPPHLREIVKEHYIEGGTVDDKAKELRVSKRIYFERLTMAKRWLHSRI